MLAEWAEASGKTLTVRESHLPVTDEVRGACELLGLDPVHVANEGTMVVAVPPGHREAALAALRAQRGRVVALVAPTALGAIAGSAILLSTPGDTFRTIVPFLILFAAVLMLFQDRLASFAANHHLNSRGEDHVPLPLHAGMYLLAVYGAYFGAGLGILTIAVLGILLPDDIQHSNALKGMLSLMINAVAVVYFALFGPVEWGPAALMALAALAGGYLGVHVARKLGQFWLRSAVIVFAVVVAIVLLVS